MLRYIYGDQLKAHERLAAEMFRDRADQFKIRLNWEVNVDEHGFERDEYDDLNPLYVICENADGTHGGSMRILPTVGRVMVNEHFPHLLGGGSISSPTIWEFTRFCLSQGANPKVAAALMLAGGEIVEGFGVEHFVGVFDACMVRIYRRIGSSPEVLGQEGEGRVQISVGLWHFASVAKAQVAQKAGLSPEISRLWFDRAFGSKECAELAKVG